MRVFVFNIVESRLSKRRFIVHEFFAGDSRNMRFMAQKCCDLKMTALANKVAAINCINQLHCSEKQMTIEKNVHIYIYILFPLERN